MPGNGPTANGVSTKNCTSIDPNATLTTTVNVAAGELMICIVGHNTARTVGSTALTDSAGNTWTRDAAAGGTGKIAIFRSTCTVALAAGGTLTLVTTGIGGGGVNMSAFKLHPYKNTPDATNTGTGASGEPSVAYTPVALNVLAIGGIAQISGVAGSPDDDADWEDLAGSSGNNVQLTCAYRIFTDLNANTWNPTTGLSVPWAAAVAGYQYNGSMSNLPLLGVS